MTAESGYPVALSVPESVVPPRFAGLTYTSFDNGSGSGGGWQVKNALGEISDAERSELVSRVATRFDLDTLLPQFPTQDDVNGRTPRLMYAKVESGFGYWHTVEAGIDGSRRPGNVFAHVILDRRNLEPLPEFRPVESWRSPSWLVPYGAAPVAATNLTSVDFPYRGEFVTRASVVAFLTDIENYRIGTLQLLLDAVWASMRGGPMVVLSSANPDTVMQWIGAASYFMSAGTSRGLCWVSHDRAPAVPEHRLRGTHVVVVPESAVAQLVPDGSFVIVGESEDPELGSLDGAPHTMRNGQTVAVTPWSVMAQAALVEDSVALRVLEQIDVVARAVGDNDLPVSWPLAMVVVTMSELADVMDEATRVISTSSVPAVRSIPHLDSLTRALRHASAPESTERAWLDLTGANSRGDDLDTYVTVYAELAVDDVDWLRRAEPLPELPAPLSSSADISDLVRTVAATVEALSTRAAEGDLWVALDSLKVAEVLMQTGAWDLVDSSIRLSMNRIVSTALPDVLFDPIRGPDFVRAVGRGNPRVLAELVRPVLYRSELMGEREFGYRFSPEVLAWMFVDRPTIPALQSLTDGLLAGAAESDVNLYAEHVYRVLSDVESVADGFHDLAGLADLPIWKILSEGSIGRESDIRRLAAAGKVCALDLALLFTRFGRAVPVDISLDQVKYADRSKDLATLIDAVLDRFDHGSTVSGVADASADDTTTAWCELRRSGKVGARTLDQINDLVTRRLPVVLDDLVDGTGRDLAADLSVDIATLYLYGCWISLPVMAGQSGMYPDAERLLARFEPEVMSALSDLAREELLDVDAVVGAAVFRDLRDRMSTRIPDTASYGVGTESDSTTRRHAALAEEFLSGLIRHGSYRGPASPEGVFEVMWPHIRELPAADAEHLIVNCRPQMKKWLGTHEIRQSGGSMRDRFPW